MTLPAEETFQRAVTALNAGDAAQAERSFMAVLAEHPKHAGALNLLGILLTRLKRFAEAEGFLQRALDENPKSDATLYNYGAVLQALNRPAEALESFSKALAINPSIAESWIGQGNALLALLRYREAAAAYGKALALKPNLADAWFGRAKAFDGLADYGEVFTALEKTLALRPSLREAWIDRGNVLTRLRLFKEAIESYDTAAKIAPDLGYAEAVRFSCKLHLCDWSGLDADIARVLAASKSGVWSCPPFILLSLPGSPADQLQNNRRFAAGTRPFAPLWRGEPYAHERIRVAYVSADLHDHAVAHMMAGVFREHDRSRFETIAISLGPDDKSDTRRALANSFEHFIDAQTQSDEEIAALMRARDVDIAVDLSGYTAGGRASVFARRPAPVQVNFVGYAGTMGTAWHDYIVGDRIVIPPEDFAFYSEKVVWLPDSFLPGDSQRRIAERTPSRAECGLPEQGFVFCCFNNAYKFSPQVFRIWMRLLASVDGSVLWLSNADPIAVANLRGEAEKAGIAPQRLVFAPRTDAIADHLARQRQADLFLDTLPYNAHATASDALWAGLPVLTCRGPAFAGRVAASLLKAAGMDELITASAEDYEALALKLARDPARLAALKGKLAENRATFPLFDTKRLARNIEAAYATMTERQRRGRPAESFAVNPAK